MDFLDYDSGDEDLTVVIESEDGTPYCETKVNSVLIKMLSPWWRVKLTSLGFKDSVQEGRCVIMHDNPRVAELALKAVKFRLRQADLVAEGDLALTFTIWQLADMWQFGYLSSICQGALQDLVKNLSTETETLTFVTEALEHSDAILEEVLVPFFVDHPKERRAKVYLALSDRAMLRLAEAAPIAGFQSGAPKFEERLAAYASTCDDNDLLQYMQHNPEARKKAIYSARSSECCMMLFAAAPLAFVKDMVSVALHSSWTQNEKELALSAIDYGRTTSNDAEFLDHSHHKLPQQAYVYRALWQCAQQRVAHPEATISQSAPWVVHCCQDYFGGDTKIVTAGPVKLQMRSVRQAVFFCSSPAYGVLFRYGTNKGVVRAAFPFAFHGGDVLIVHESPNAAVLKMIN